MILNRAAGFVGLAKVFLNLSSDTVDQSDGEHDVNIATDLGVWIFFNGVNIINLFIESGGVFTNVGGTLTFSLLHRFAPSAGDTCTRGGRQCRSAMSVGRRGCMLAPPPSPALSAV